MKTLRKISCISRTKISSSYQLGKLIYDMNEDVAEKSCMFRMKISFNLANLSMICMKKLRKKNPVCPRRRSVSAINLTNLSMICMKTLRKKSCMSRTKINFSYQQRKLIYDMHEGVAKKSCMSRMKINFSYQLGKLVYDMYENVSAKSYMSRMTISFSYQPDTFIHDMYEDLSAKSCMFRVKININYRLDKFVHDIQGSLSIHLRLVVLTNLSTINREVYQYSSNLSS
ncbi:hypothetical protein ACOSQ3_019286 [Xanthoceras sorbifolium]